MAQLTKAQSMKRKADSAPEKTSPNKKQRTSYETTQVSSSSKQDSKMDAQFSESDYITSKKDQTRENYPSESLSEKGTSPILLAEILKVDGLDFPVLDPPSERLKKAAAIACRVYKNSKDLEGQQQRYGKCIKSPLPTSLTGTTGLNPHDHYLLEDADNTEQYQKFENWVFGLSTSEWQDRCMGVVVTTSGCGKTHFAKVFTRRKRAIYLNFAPNSSSYKVLVSAIKLVRDQIKPRDIQSYAYLTEEARAITLLFLTCALDYYGRFLIACTDHLKNMDESMLTWIGSLAFSENNIHLFHTLFNEKKKLSPKDREQYIDRVRHLVRVLRVRALFCDRITSLSELFVGQFLHECYGRGWTDGEKMQLLLDEQKRIPDAKEEFNKPTSLMYLVVNAMKRIEIASDSNYPISSVALATSFSGLETEIVPGILAIYNDEFRIEREEKATYGQFVSLVKDKFGDGAAEEWLSLVPPEIGVRSTYLSVLWTEIIRNGCQLQRVLGDSVTNTTIEKKAKELVEKIPAEFKYRILYWIVFHNGVRTCYSNTEGVLGNDFTCVPSRILSNEGEQYTVQVSDKLFVDAVRRVVTQPNSSLLQEIVASHFSENSNIVIKGDLMSTLALTHKGKRFSELAVPGASFPDLSVANSLTVDVLQCGDAEDFALETIDVLLNPIERLKERLLMLSDVVKPDGLSIAHRTIVAWRSKYREGFFYKDSNIDAKALEKTLKSLDPSTFFQQHDKLRQVWREALKSKELYSLWFDCYVRVIIAKNFTEDAVHFANTWNERYLQHPVILVQGQSNGIEF